MDELVETEEVDYGEDEGDAPSSAEKAAVEIGTGEEIYGDLYDDEGEKDKLLRAKYIALQEQCRNHEATISKLRGKLENLTVEKEEFQEERRILIRNISCLFRTAQEEMTRRDDLMQSKERTIISLKTKLAGRSNASAPTSPTQMPQQNWQATPH